MRKAGSIIAGLLLFAASSAALAGDGRLGPMSSGTVVIRVSVAPRAWQASANTLCVAGPASGYSVRMESASTPAIMNNGKSGACPRQAEELKLLDQAAVGRSTLLIIPQ